MDNNLLLSPLNNCHIKCGAKFIEFGGWYLPLQYQGIIKECLAVRQNVGMFDVSHLGEVLVAGEDTMKYLNYLLSNDVANASEGKAIYSLMLNEKGTIIDDLVVFKENENKFLVIINASRINIDFNWMQQQAKKYNVNLQNLSFKIGCIAVQGPKSKEVLENVFNPFPKLNYYTFTKLCFEGEDIYFSRTGYTGELGFEIFAEKNILEKLWDKFIDLKIVPCGLGARDVLRLESAMPLYGQDINENISPLETFLMFAVQENKNFIGREEILKLRKKGINKKLIGIILNEAIARHNDKIFINDKEIGFITSGTFSPTLKKGIALGYINCKYTNENQQIQVEVRNKKRNAKIIKLPFYKGSAKQQM